MSILSWAIRFAASLENVMVVLSGMSSVEQMRDNLSYMQHFQPLNDDEQRIIQQAQRLMGASATVPCTACRYCTDGCPMQIPIPDIFTAMNKQLGNGQAKEAKDAYAAAVNGKGKASDCVRCRQCEEACPQHIHITEELEKVVGMLE